MMTLRTPDRHATRGTGTGVSGGNSKIATGIILLGASVFLVGGVWAFGWPYSFYATVATFPPFNLHLFHDLGAFQLGIGAAMICGLIWRDALLVGSLGGTVGATVHAVSHILDADLGGRASDPYLVTALAVLLAAVTAAAAVENKRRRRTAGASGA